MASDFESTHSFGPLLEPIFAEVVVEMNVARLAGWSGAHDDAEGWQHLATEAGYRIEYITTGSRYPTDDEINRTLTVAIGLLVNARLTLARARAVGTFTVDEFPPGVDGQDGAVMAGREVVHLILSPAAARTMCDLRALDVMTTESLGSFTCPDCRKRALAELV